MHIRYYSQIQRNLREYVDHGKVNRTVKLKEFQREPISPQKLLLQLQARYDSHKWQHSDGTPMNIAKLRPSDLRATSDKARVVFDNLIRFKQMTKKLIYTPVLYSLLGVSETQLKDEFAVTKSVMSLLKKDGNSGRAEYLARLAGSRGVVAMNQIMQWHLEHGNVDNGLRTFHNRKRWSIDTNDQTYIILFSGLSRAVEWGKLTRELAERVLAIYETATVDAEMKTPTFNAMMSFLVKNFDDNQRLAWNFFDKVIPDEQGKVVIIPDCQLFTVLLNGIKKKVEIKVDSIRGQRQMLVASKEQQIGELQGQLVATAEVIYGKVLAGAIPPSPPTKEAVEANPELLVNYRQKARRKLISIDEAFVLVFCGCYISKNSGARYAARGLEYLRAFNPEIRKLFVLLGENAGQPTKMAKMAIDTIDLPPFVAANVNPMVVFPPPLTSKNKKRAIFSNKQKPLVDFTRPTYDENRAAFLAKQYQLSKGRHGRKLAVLAPTETPPIINRFHLQLIIDGLIKLGRFSEFERSLWYVLCQYGDIRIGTDGEFYKLSENVTTVPTLYQTVPELGAKPVRGAANGWVPGAVDIGIIENFLYKLNQHGNYQGNTKIKQIVSLFAAVVNPKCNPNNELKIRQSTIDAVWASMVTSLHYYNDYNVNVMKRQGVPNIPRKLVTSLQLNEIVVALRGYVDSLNVHYNCGRAASDYLLPNYVIDPFNRIVERLYQSTWMEADDEAIHRQIIRAGILYYTPPGARNPTEKLTSLEITPSIEFVYNLLNDRDDLNAGEAKLMKQLRQLLQMRTLTQANIDRLGHLQNWLCHNVYSSLHD